MSEDIKELNKKIAPFILLSVALAVPASSADADNDMQNTQEISTQESRQVMLFYGAPQIPPKIIINEGQPNKNAQIVFYGAPQIPDEKAVELKKREVPPVISYYAAPSIPIEKEPPEDMSQRQGYRYSVIDDIPEVKQTKEKNTSLWERIKQVFKRNNDK